MMGSVLWRKLAGNHLIGEARLLSGWRRSFSSKLYVSRLSFYTTDEEFRQAFSRFGKITEARLVWDHITRRPKGFGFVTFDTEVEAQRALKAMDGRIYKGRLIFVEFAKSMPEEEKAPS